MRVNANPRSLIPFLLVIFTAGCSTVHIVLPLTLLLDNADQFPSPTGASTKTITLALINTPSPTKTSTQILAPLKLVYYGDRVLKGGDDSRQGELGYSICDVLSSHLRLGAQVIISNHGGRKAKRGYENQDQTVLVHKTDFVTIW